MDNTQNLFYVDRATEQLAQEHATRGRSWYEANTDLSDIASLLTAMVKYQQSRITNVAPPLHEYMEVADEVKNDLENLKKRIDAWKADSEDIIEELWLRSIGVEQRDFPIRSTFSDYSVVFYGGGRVQVFDEDNDYDYMWDTTMPEGRPVEGWVIKIYTILEKVRKIFPKHGGWSSSSRKEIIHTLYYMDILQGYL